MERKDQPFIEIDKTIISLNAIAFIVPFGDGGLKIVMSTDRQSGSPYAFTVVSAKDAESVRRLFAPYIAFTLKDVRVTH